MTIEAEAINLYQEFVEVAVSQFLPIFATISGVFLAFAIANMARFLILKMVKGKN